MAKKARQCGTCTACCTTMAVSEIGKAQDVRCSHLSANFDIRVNLGAELVIKNDGCAHAAERESHVSGPLLAGKGCFIYADRPTACRDFSCFWLHDNNGVVVPSEYRPDRCGLVLDLTAKREGLVQAIIAHEHFDGAADAAEGAALLGHLAARHVVIIRKRDGNRLIRGPRHLTEPYQRALLTRRDD